MKFKDLLKKYWFVGLVGILLIVFVGAYATDSIKNKKIEVNTLTVDGKDVVYSINGENYYFADDLYNDLNETFGDSLGFVTFYHSLLNAVVPTTEELTNYATNWAAYILQQEDETNIDAYMKQAGYKGIDELSNYCMDSLKHDKLLKDTYYANPDEYVNPVLENENPRYVSHILIKVADVEEITDEEGNVTHKCNPTDEEKTKLENCLAAIAKDDRAFGDIAQEYSEDGSATNGGLLGLVYTSNSSQYVKEFADASMSAKDGVITEPIETQYGYHIIRVEVPSFDELIADADFFEVINQANPNLDLKLLMDKAPELNYEIIDQRVIDYVNSYLEAE